MTDDVGGDRPPWHRNPWVWGVLAGLVFVPAIRPLTRHVPDAPPILGELPDFEFQGLAGRRVSKTDLLGHVYALAIASSSCDLECAAIYQATEQLADRYQAFERGISVLLVDFSHEPRAGASDGQSSPPLFPSIPGELDGKTDRTAGQERADWILLRGGVDQVYSLVKDGLAPLLEQQQAPGDLESFAHESRLFLVDADGHLRGHYGVDESGLDEVYHRAQHVLRDYRKAHRWDR